MRFPETFPSRKALIWGAFCGMLGLLCAFNPWSGELDRKCLDLNFRIHRQLTLRRARGPEIVIVGLDEASTRGIPEPLALYHRPLGRFLEALALAHPAAVGLDIILPEQSWDAFMPGLDAALMRGILTLKAEAPLVLGRTEIHGLPRPIHAPFETAAGMDRIGFVQCGPDPDRVVRRFETRLGEHGAVVPTFADRLLAPLGRQARPGLINFSLGAPFEYIPFHRVLDWQQQGRLTELREAFAGKVVLLGTVIPYEDRIPLPVQLASWEHPSTLDSPGMLLQAQILRTQLSAAVLVELPRWASALLALLAALGGMNLAGRARKGFLLLGLAHLVTLGAAYLLLGLDVFLPFVGMLAALDLAYVLSARRRARLRLEAEVKERRVLERALLDTSERERRDIGHELHDGVCQQITGALLRCRVAERLVEGREAPEKVHLRAMAELLETSLGETHNLAQGLSPGDLEPGSLGSALEELARRTRETFDVNCESEEDGSSARIDGPATTQLYRIAQEAVANALKHAAPGEIRLSLGAEKSRLLLRVVNDGCSPEPGAASGGMGRRIMGYRAELISAELSLGPREGGGAILTCSLPLSPTARESSHA